MISYLTRCRRLMLAFVVSLSVLVMFATPRKLQQYLQQGSSEELPEQPEEDRGEEIGKKESFKEPDEHKRVKERHVEPRLVVLSAPPTIAIVVSVAPPLHPSQFSVRRLI